MKQSYLLKILLLVFILTTGYSCKEKDKDKDGIPDKKDNCPDVYANTKDGCPEREIDKIHFFLETSASMGGYFQKDAEFKTIITDITSKIENEIKPIDIWFISDSSIKYPSNTQQFSSDIATTKIAVGNSSQLHLIINEVASKTDSNDVSILVSDCILSYPDDAIKKDPEINKTEAPNALKQNIYSTFSDLKKKGFGASVYAFSSSFYTDNNKRIYYYDYQNKKTAINGNKRPFYIWVIGDKELLMKFNSRLADISSFKPEQSLQFGLNEEPVTKYSILPQLERTGNWERKKSNEIIKIKESDQFSVAVNLEKLPEYARDIAYLKKNIEIENNGCKVNFEIKDKSVVDRSRLRSPTQVQLYENSSHVMIFKVNEMALRTAQIIVTLPLHYDTWYLDWSCDDDRNIKVAEGKTFAFEHLITGVKEAYETKNKNYIDFLITLNK